MAGHTQSSAGKRSAEARRTIVSELICKGKYTYEELRKALAERGISVSVMTIKQDVDILDARWKEAQLENIEKKKRRELQKIAYNVGLLFEDYEKSRAPKVKDSFEQLGAPSAGGTGAGAGAEGGINTTKVKKSRTTEEQPGDPRIMAEIRMQQAEARKIEGTYSSDKVDAKIVVEQIVGLNVE